MKSMGIKSADLGDVFAFLFLENVFYTEAYENVVIVDESPEAQEQAAKKSRFSQLKEAAKKEFGTWLFFSIIELLAFSFKLSEE